MIAALVVYVVVCYFIVQLFFKKKDNIAGIAITAILLAAIGLGGAIYWSHVSVRCTAQESPVTIDQLVGKWKLPNDILTVTPDMRFEMRSTGSSNLTFIGEVTIEGSLVTFIEDIRPEAVTNNRWQQVIEICSTDDEELKYHNISGSYAGSDELKEVATKIN
ncbi:hypothetical protein [Dyadobacter bucti]|uniref:hypothetical protein n=1 Tax=Dyadobacter bucti TaxID=2572203 RepID=UPI001109A9DA|nr:hypothetical protein [Dyadobacter bucti]